MPSKSRSIELPPPVFTVRAAPVKSITRSLGRVLLVPPPWLIATARLVTSTVNPSTPMIEALPTVAFKAVKLRRSVGTAGRSGAFALARARAKSTSSRLNPSAPGSLAGPLTPAKALRSDAPTVKSSTSRLLPPLKVTVRVLFSKAKFPETKKKLEIPNSTEPSSCKMSAASSKMISTVPPGVTIDSLTVCPVLLTLTARSPTKVKLGIPTTEAVPDAVKA